ncbi:hypothetical protein JCGZ_11070 [Jatropha curcas]|uniref:Ubiquitin-like domain-containing protein n=2 Tax=Jatropha curcas TaxID=180498 RepID=A0A067KQE5_JATCU|nr:hypothetical protein JCGZ_11070 [Jatropha curcas]
MLVWINYEGIRYPVVLPENPIVQDIKEAIHNEQHLRFEVEEQLLLYQSIYLGDNNDTVEYYGIQPNSEIIVLVMRRIKIDYNLARFTVTIWDQSWVFQLKHKFSVATRINYDKLVFLLNGSELKFDRKISSIPLEDNLVAVLLFEIKIIEEHENSYDVIVHNLMTVAQVKQKLYRSHLLDPEKLKLYYYSMETTTFLEDDRTLRSYEILQEGTVIHAVREQS